MNINDFSQKPQSGRTYAKNEVPAFVISTQSTLLAVLTTGSETVFEGSYSPDFNGQISIDFKGLYDRYLETQIPSSSGDDIQHTAYRRQFTATFHVLAGGNQSGDPATLSWYVVNARLKASVVFNTWYHSNFLTNQPIEKLTNYESPEWLSWLDPSQSGGTSLVARFYPKSGGNIDTEVFTPSVGGCHSVNVRYSRLIRLINALPGQLHGYYDLILFSTKDDSERCRQRYIYKERSGMEKYFCFVNALGGIDTIICDGENVLQPETTHNVGRFANRYRALDDTDDRRKWSQNTGLMPTGYRNWVYELLTAKQGAQKYDPAAMDYYDIVVDSSDIAVSDYGQLASVSFGYILDDTENVIQETERAVGRMLHKSIADASEAMDDITVKSVAVFEDDGHGNFETEELEIGATKLYVSDQRTLTTAGEPQIYYFIDGSDTASGSFAPSDTPYVITKQKSETIRFATQNDKIESLLINYYN